MNMITQQPVTLTVGIFFDGTGFSAGQVPQETTAPYPGSSRRGSNIWQLYMLYQTGKSVSDITLKLYVPGAGIKPDGENSLVGAATGRFSTGIIGKVYDALEQLSRALSSAIQTAGPSTIRIRYDLFGFSRGASSARHLAGMIQDADPDVIQSLSALSEKQADPVFPAGKVRFVGLFDSVSAIADLDNGYDPGSADTGLVRLRLRPGAAEHVFHIIAGHECRYNFALNSVSPAWPELELPGVHGDIGGSYHTEEDEYLYLTSPATRPRKSTGASRLAAEEMLRTLQGYPALTPVFLHSSPFITSRRGSEADVVVVKRRVLNHWSVVVLQVMCDAARDAGVTLAGDATGDTSGLPSELHALFRKALKMGKDIRTTGTADGMTTDELRILSKYIHCSANWGNVPIPAPLSESRPLAGPDTATPEHDIFFINRPGLNWTRTVYDMNGKRRLLV